MTNTHALREKIEHLANSANALLVEMGSVPWTKEEQTSFDNIADEIERHQKQIKSIERMRELEADKYFDAVSKPGRSDGEAIDAVAAVALYLRNGKNVTSEQAAAIHNAMSTTTPSEGGYTVPTEVEAMVIDRMKAFGGMREVAQILPTSSGSPLNYPSSDGTEEEGEIVAENAGAGSQDVTFGTVALNPYKYSSKSVALPVELIQDSAIDVVSFVTERLAVRLGRITNKHYTLGSGSTQPFGLTNRAEVGKTGAKGAATTVSYDDLMDLIHSVNSAYRHKNSRFMFSDATLAVLRKIKDTTGRPVWGLGDMKEGVPSSLCGYGYTENDHMPAMAANAKSIAFGDFSKFVIRDVVGTTSLRRFDDSAFALKGQVGFCGWTRTGSNLLDTAAVKLFVNSAT